MMRRLMTMARPIYCKRYPYTLYTLWGEIVGGIYEDYFALTATIDGDDYNIITPEWFEDALEHKYYDRLFYSLQTTPENASADFAVTFTNWKNQTSSNWERMLQAVIAEYNPVENYASNETIETTYGHKIETEHGHVIETEHGHVIETEHGHTIDTEHGLQVDTEYGKTITDTNAPDGATVTTSHDTFGYNSANAVPADVTTAVKTGSETDTAVSSGTDTITNSGTDTVTNSGTDTDTHSGKDTDTHSGKDTTTTTKSGNIGTMTATTMINEEIKLRLFNITECAIKSFINSCTIY